MKKIISLTLVGFLVLGVACTKAEIEIPVENKTDFQIIDIENNAPIDDVVYIYYLDGQQVEGGVFSVGDEGLYIVTTLDNDKDGKPVIAQYAFTSQEGYVAFGTKHGIKLKEQLDFVAHMREYAKTSGAIGEYELTGIVPGWYTKYEEQVYDNIFGSAGTKSLAITLYKDVSGGPSGVMAVTLPVMWPGWNNTVSRLYIVGLGGGASLFNRAFYFKHLETIVNWSGTYYLQASDNKMSSGIHIL